MLPGEGRGVITRCHSSTAGVAGTGAAPYLQERTGMVARSDTFLYFGATCPVLYFRPDQLENPCAGASYESLPRFLVHKSDLLAEGCISGLREPVGSWQNAASPPVGYTSVIRSGAAGSRSRASPSISRGERKVGGGRLAEDSGMELGVLDRENRLTDIREPSSSISPTTREASNEDNLVSPSLLGGPEQGYPVLLKLRGDSSSSNFSQSTNMVTLTTTPSSSSNSNEVGVQTDWSLKPAGSYVYMATKLAQQVYSGAVTDRLQGSPRRRRTSSETETDDGEDHFETSIDQGDTPMTSGGSLTTETDNYNTTAAPFYSVGVSAVGGRGETLLTDSSNSVLTNSEFQSLSNSALSFRPSRPSREMLDSRQGGAEGSDRYPAASGTTQHHSLLSEGTLWSRGLLDSSSSLSAAVDSRVGTTDSYMNSGPVFTNTSETLFSLKYEPSVATIVPPCYASGFSGDAGGNPMFSSTGTYGPGSPAQFCTMGADRRDLGSLTWNTATEERPDRVRSVGASTILNGLFEEEDDSSATDTDEDFHIVFSGSPPPLRRQDGGSTLATPAPSCSPLQPFNIADNHSDVGLDEEINDTGCLSTPVHSWMSCGASPQPAGQVEQERSLMRFLYLPDLGDDDESPTTPAFLSLDATASDTYGSEERAIAPAANAIVNYHSSVSPPPLVINASPMVESSSSPDSGQCGPHVGQPSVLSLLSRFLAEDSPSSPASDPASDGSGLGQARPLGPGRQIEASLSIATVHSMGEKMKKRKIAPSKALLENRQN